MFPLSTLTALFAMTAGLTAQQSGDEPLTVSIPSGYGFDTFQVEQPQGRSSAAARLNYDRADLSGVVPAPTDGYVLHNRVVVEAADDSLLLSVVRSIDEGSQVNAHPLQGFWLVKTADVQSAIEMTAALEPIFGVGLVYLEVERPVSTRVPSDPKFGQQWHLLNTSLPAADANVEPAWNAGYTGTGVVVGVIDGGVQTGHEDLAANYNSTASKSGGSSSHGTSVAGVIAAVEGNGKGGVGAAYDAQWSKLYYGSSSSTADNFLWRNDINDIKNNSWGPYDDGTIWTMSSVERNALRDSVANGRGGLGEIFTWAAGNGGTFDRVDYDPYASSRYTVAVGAIGDLDKRAGYNETGSSMLVVAHSSGNNRGITTTDLNGYTSSFGGTSSASPLGAGVIALMLEANPALTWRDVQHVLVHSARLVDSSNSKWKQNGAGHDFNENYGFGSVDAGAATTLAANWINVSPVQIYNTGKIAANITIPNNDPNGLEYTISVPDSFYLEHAELILNVNHNYLGDLKIWLKSPDGTRSLFTKQRNDNKDDLVNYVFTTVRSWDEQSDGDWTFHISDEAGNATGTLVDYKLKLYGNDGSHLGGGGFRITASNLTAGQTATLTVSEGAPNTMTWLAYSITGLGSYPVPPLGVTLGIDSPIQLGSPLTTDGAGSAGWSAPVPGGAAGVPVWFQALQMNNVSSILASTIN
jgi:subtilisin-like proprotein convertase family protein